MAVGLRLCTCLVRIKHLPNRRPSGVQLTFTFKLTSTIIAIYFCLSIVIAYASRRQGRSSNDFLNATRSLPTWVAAMSFLACNCGALDVLGLSGIALRYGVQAFHFYWIGAIPALIFMSFVMIPVYVKSSARSVPEYLGQRFGPRLRLLNAASVLVSTALYVGISLYALAEVTDIAFGWSFFSTVVLFGSVVLAYVLTGGFRATVYNEILQFLYMFAGLLPLLYFTHKVSGVCLLHAGQYWHVWSATPVVSSKAQVDLIGVVAGLGGVVSFSYWCTDYGLVQRALTARNLEAARKVPLLAGFGKILFSFVIVVPVVLMSGQLHKRFGMALDETIPTLIATMYGPRLVGVGITALMAGLLNSLASNISAFSSLWTGEIYRPFLNPHRTESHYRNVGRAASVCSVAIGIVVALWTRNFENLSALVLLIFSLFIAPFFAVLLTGSLSRRTTMGNAIGGALAGFVAGGGIQFAYAERWLTSGSRLSANLYSAIVSFAAAVIVCNAPALLWRRRRMTRHQQEISPIKPTRQKPSVAVWCLAGALLITCVAANGFWW